VCGDNRFGRYEVYPSIGIGWQPHDDLMIELGFPTTRLIYEPLPNVNLSLRVTPDGNEWHVKSTDMEKQSGLVFEALLLEWAASWQAHSRLAITASLGRLFHNRYAATLLDDSQVRLSDRAVTRVGAALGWRF
jgi:hypothetical protein